MACSLDGTTGAPQLRSLGAPRPILPPAGAEGRETLATLLKRPGLPHRLRGQVAPGTGLADQGDYALPATYQDPNVDQDLCFTGIDFTAPITDGPNQHGFDYFYGMPASLDQPPLSTSENDRVLTPAGPHDRREGTGPSRS